MSIRFDYPTAASPSLTWAPSKPPRLPLAAAADFPRQVSAETAGGILYTQDLGPVRETYELVFDHLPAADRDQARTFFDTVKKAFTAFDYTDPGGQVQQVRWVSAFDFRTVAHGRFSGKVELRKE